MMRTVEEIQAAISETQSMLSKRKSDLSDYEDEYNRAKRNGDEDMASYWKSQMNYAQNRIDELEGVLDDEQAELKSAQAASSTDDSGSTSTISGGSTSTVSSGSTSTVSSGSATTSTVSANYYTYAGGNQVISNYAGEQIMLGTAPTGAFFGGGNFALTSATGTLLIQNANDKLISFTDGAGNPYAKAYAATNPGVIDGRGLTGYEVITGSDLGGDVIYAGDGGSQLWGGNGNGADVLTGGGGADIFIGGKTQGSDVFFNASSADVVNLNDATLSDIVAAAESDGTIILAFNTGNVIAVQSSEALSSAFMLADGSAYRFNHATQSWQTA